MKPIDPISLDAIYAARARVYQAAYRTPLIRLNLDDAPAEIYLKLENLQPMGSFKIRGASNAMALAPHDQLAGGVYTASTGNMAQGVAWNAKRLGLPCTVVVPDTAPQTKLDSVRRLGAQIVKVTFDAWWQVLMTHHYAGLDAFFIHPVSDPNVIAGHGTIGLEILEDLPDVDAVVIPYGGGGLSSGIASAIRALKPETKLYAAEVDTAAPLAPSLAANKPLTVNYTPTFIGGIGGKSVLEEMWPLVSTLLDGALVNTLEEIVAAIRLLVERHRVVAEGAGGAPLAAALAGRAGSGKVVCVVSGGNLDAKDLIRILQGEIP